jgi:hypothetical protein
MAAPAARPPPAGRRPAPPPAAPTNKLYLLSPLMRHLICRPWRGSIPSRARASVPGCRVNRTLRLLRRHCCRPQRLRALFSLPPPTAHYGGGRRPLPRPLISLSLITSCRLVPSQPSRPPPQRNTLPRLPCLRASPPGPQPCQPAGRCCCPSFCARRRPRVSHALWQGGQAARNAPFPGRLQMLPPAECTAGDHPAVHSAAVTFFRRRPP